MFRYRLQTVLDHRKRQEEEKQRELALVNRELAAVREKLDWLVAGREESARELTRLSATATDAKVLRMYNEFLMGRDADIVWKRREAGQVNERLKVKQLELQEYVKRRRVLEIHRDRQREVHQLGENRREAAFIDETATQMFLRERAV